VIDLTDWKLIGDQRRILPLASLFLLFTGGAVLGEWQIELVDSPKQFSRMGTRSLCLDSNGYPHTAYGEDHLYYAWYDGEAWNYELVDDSRLVGRFSFLALMIICPPGTFMKL